MIEPFHIDRWSPEEASPDGCWWAVLDRCDDDAGPYPPVALFRERADAQAYIRAAHPDDAESPLAFQACTAPAALLKDGTLAVANDYRIDTPGDLSDALEGGA